MTRAQRVRSNAAKLAAMRRRIVIAFDEASADDLAAGIEWYNKAERAAAAIAEGTPITTRQAAGIIAALSPRCQWSTNVAWAAKVIEAYNNGEPCPAVSTTNNRTKAWNIVSGADPLDELSGPKVRAFFLNITGDHHAVTVDTWACRVAEGASVPTRPVSGGPDHWREVVPPDTNRYNLIARAYREAADIVGHSPREVQAAAWVHARGSAD